MVASARSFALAAATAALMTASAASAQTFPSRTVQLVVAYAPGGTGDVVARLIAAKLASALGQSVVVENRAGASGAIGAQAVIRAAPDGHTLLIGQTAEVAINQHWVKGIGYDPDTDLVPVALASVVPLALVVPGSAPFSNVAELLAAARGSTKGMSFASAGTGTPGHFAGEFLKLKSKGNLVHVPYKGAGPALNDVVGGHVDMYFSGFPAAFPHVKSGALKVLAVSTAKRSGIAPETPAVAETSGFEDFDLTLWQGVFAPRGTPKEVVARINAEINAVLAQPDIKEKLKEIGADSTPMPVEQFAGFVRAESRKYLRIIKETGVTAE